MFKLSKEQKRWWEFLWAMTERELKVGYKNTLLGFGWMVINPVLQMVIFGLLFQLILKMKTENYFLFLFSGLILWNYFSYTINKSTSIIVSRRSLIHKANFPREILVLSVVFSNLIHLFLSILLLLIIGVFVFGFGIFFGWWKVLIAVLWLLILTIGMSLGLSAINVKHRDINFIINILMPLWFYATPIVYDLRMLPGSLNKLVYLNPVTGIIELFRYGIVGILPLNINLCMLSFVISLLIFILGVSIFKKNNHSFDDWV